jgi:hypothetical protein
MARRKGPVTTPVTLRLLLRVAEDLSDYSLHSGLPMSTIAAMAIAAWIRAKARTLRPTTPEAERLLRRILDENR